MYQSREFQIVTLVYKYIGFTGSKNYCHISSLIITKILVIFDFFIQNNCQFIICCYMCCSFVKLSRLSICSPCIVLNFFLKLQNVRCLLFADSRRTSIVIFMSDIVKKYRFNKKKGSIKLYRFDTLRIRQLSPPSTL